MFFLFFFTVFQMFIIFSISTKKLDKYVLGKLYNFNTESIFMILSANKVLKYKTIRLLRCIHDFKPDIINNMDHIYI